MDEKGFEVGDFVTVVNNGQTYSTYEKLAVGIVDMKKWKYGEVPENEDCGIIVNHRATENSRSIYCVEIDGTQYLIGSTGLRLDDNQINNIPQIEIKKILFKVEDLVL